MTTSVPPVPAETQSPIADLPPHEAPEPAPPQFYALNSSRVTLKEYRFGTPLLLMPIAALLKLLRVQVPSSTDDLNADSLMAGEVDALNPGDVAPLEPMLAELRTLGFTEVLYHAFDDTVTHTRRRLVTLARGDGSAIARVCERVWTGTTKHKTHRYVEFLTAFDDGTFLWSTSAEPDMIAPSSSEVLRKPGTAPTELWTSHKAAAAQRVGHGRVFIARTAEEIRNVTEAHHASLRDFHLARGVFKPLKRNPSEAALPAAAVADVGADNAMVYAEMQRLQNKQGRWTTALLILLVSLAFFVGLGVASWSWDLVILLVPVLFIHELGHYIAMKLFGYRDLRMFFIPLFGAAVSGKAYHVAGWKQVVVALAGPLPGITIGTVCGIVGLITGKTFLIDFAVMSLVLNALNLLPFLPLDGGRVMQAVLFARHHVLDTLFRSFAVFVLLGLFFLLHDRWLMFLAIFIGISLPASFLLTRTTNQLRREGVTPDPAAGATIPPALARTIIERVRAAFSNKGSAKTIAQHSLQVYETLSAKPPHWFASIVFVGVQVSAFLFALLLGTVFVLGRDGTLTDFARIAADTGDFPFVDDPADLRAWHGGEYAHGGERLSVIARFPDGGAADRFDEMSKSLPAQASMLQMGPSLFVSLPAGDDALREQCIRDLGVDTENIRVQQPGAQPSLSLVCIAKNDEEARAIEEELQAFLQAPAPQRLIPPWVKDDPRTPAERDRHAGARRTYFEINNVGWDAEDPAYLANTEAIRTAARLGDTKRVEQLQAENQKLREDAKKAKLAALRQDPKSDPAIFERVEAIGEGPDWSDDMTEDTFNKAWEAHAKRRADELTPLLGEVDPAHPRADALTRVSAQAGGLQRAGMLLHVQYLTLNHPPDGVPALVEWLHARGCIDVRAQWHGFMDPWASMGY